MPGIFISYRRDDTSGYTGWLHQELSNHFGSNRVFMDIRVIQPGEDFVDVIETEIGSCNALIVVMGKQWLTATDDKGQRLTNPHDYVRLEIEAALQRKILIIPTLVNGARMPRAEELPVSLSHLARRNALELRDTSWKGDVERLITILETVMPPPIDAEQLVVLSLQLDEAETQKKWDMVIEIGEHILKEDSQHQPTRSKTAIAYYSRGMQYNNRKNFDLAIENFNRAIVLNGQDAEYYRQRGIAYRHKGDYNKAIADLNQAIRLNPRDGRLYYSRGLIHKAFRQLEAAYRDYELAAKLGHDRAKTELLNW